MFELTPFNHKKNELTRKNDVWNMSSLFDDFFNNAMQPVFFTNTSMTSIKADIRETEKEYIVDAEIPGCKKEDIQLDLKDDMLTIGVEQKSEINEENDRYIRRERRVGSFKRSFYVEGVKHEEVSAKYNDGILTIILPKETQKKETKHQIEIN